MRPRPVSPPVVRPAVPRVVRLLVAVVAVATLGAATAAAAPAPGPYRTVEYHPPVPGGVVADFVAPDSPWSPGRRGVRLTATPGETVRAAGEGVVTFVGPVAGVAWVSVGHPDGVVTSYGPLATFAVAVGDSVGAGSVLGTLAFGLPPFDDGLHWGARRDGVYVDPLSLLPRWRPALVGPGAVAATDAPEPAGYGQWSGRSGLRGRLGLVEGSPLAREPGWELAPNPNHVIGVAGLSSDTARTPMDLSHLGYAPEQITYLSYRGRAEGRGPDDDPRRDQQPYDRADTWHGVHAAAERLREQLRAQWARRPGEAVDLVGHSMGGLVVAYYLLTMHDPADPSLPPIGHAVVLAAPLEGSDLATAALSAARNPAALALIRGGGAAIGLPPPDPRRDRAPHDVALRSDVSRAIADGWRAANADVYAGPLATGTRVMTFGGSRDVIVPERRTSLDGGDHVVLPGGHTRMRRTEASRIAVRAFLAGEPVPGESGGLGHYASYPLGWVQRALGTALRASPASLLPDGGLAPAPAGR